MANLSLLPNSSQEKLKENVALPVRKDENYYSQDQWPHPFTCKCSQSSRIPAFCLCSRIHIQSATLSHSSRETLALRGLNFLRDVIMRIFNSEGGKMWTWLEIRVKMEIFNHEQVCRTKFSIFNTWHYTIWK